MVLRKLATVVFLCVLCSAGLLGQTSQQSLMLTRIYGITGSWASPECGTNGINNSSAVSRHNNYHSIYATGAGSWTVAINYSDTSCSGPWTSFGSASTMTQASNPPIAYANGYHPYIQIVVTGSATVTYSACKDFFLSTAVGSLTFPITSAQGGTGLSTLTTHGIFIGEGTSTPTLLTPGAAGTAVVSNGASADPSYQAIVNSFGPSGTPRTGTVVTTSGDYTTDQITEATAKFFTNARAIAAFSGVSPITLSGAGAIGCATCFVSPSASAQLQYLRIRPNTGNLTTSEFASLPTLNAADYAFPMQAPPENLSPTLKSVTMTPCPLGTSASDTAHFLGIFNNSGVWQNNALINGGSCTPGLSSGTITFSSLAGTYSTGTYAIGSATAGMQEAHNSAADGSIIVIPPGDSEVYAPTTVTKSVRFVGATSSYVGGSRIVAETTGQTVFDVEGTLGTTFEHFGVYRASLQTSGYTFYLNNDTKTAFNDVYFLNGYDEIHAANSSQTWVDHCYLGTFGHDGIFLASAIPDATGGHFTNNDFFSDGPNMRAGIYHTGPGSIQVIGNGFHNRSPFGVYTSPSGPSGQMTIALNHFDGQSSASMRIDPAVAWGGYQVIGNLVSTSGAAAGLWVTNPLANSGTAVGNVFVGAGQSSLILNGTNWMALGNTIVGTAGAMQSNAGVNVTFGPNAVSGFTGTYPVFGGGTNILIKDPTPLTYTQVTNSTWADGSTASVSNGGTLAGGNTALTSGGSGCHASKANGTWTCDGPAKALSTAVATNSTSSVSTTALMTAPAAGTYRVSWSLTTGSVSGGTATASVTIGWTDAVGAKTNSGASLTLGDGANQEGSIIVLPASGDITVAATYAAGTGGNYNLTTTVERIN